MQQQAAIVQHLNPLVLSGFFEDQDLLKLRERLVFHAWKGFEHLETSRSLYTSRHTVPLLSFWTVCLADALLVHLPHVRRQNSLSQSLSAMIENCLCSLQQARNGFPFCDPLQKVLAERASEHGHEVLSETDDMFPSLLHVDLEDILEALSRPTYTQPLDFMVSRIHPAISEEWPSAWGGQRIGSIASLLNKD